VARSRTGTNRNLMRDKKKRVKEEMSHKAIMIIISMA
jgi:hypothetical protein